MATTQQNPVYRAAFVLFVVLTLIYVLWLLGLLITPELVRVTGFYMVTVFIAHLMITSRSAYAAWDAALCVGLVVIIFRSDLSGFIDRFDAAFVRVQTWPEVFCNYVVELLCILRATLVVFLRMLLNHLEALGGPALNVA